MIDCQWHAQFTSISSINDMHNSFFRKNFAWSTCFRLTWLFKCYSYSSFQAGGFTSAATYGKSLGYSSEDIERLRAQDIGEGQVKIRCLLDSKSSGCFMLPLFTDIVILSITVSLQALRGKSSPRSPKGYPNYVQGTYWNNLYSAHEFP